MKRILHLGYFLIKTDYADLAASIRCAAKKGHSRFRLLAEMIFCSLRYGSSFVDYFNFQFYRKGAEEKAAYATMGLMYDFHRRVNDPMRVAEVDDKRKFAENFSSFCRQPHIFRQDEWDRVEAFVLSRRGKKIVLKDPAGTAGREVKVLKVDWKGDSTFFTDPDGKRWSLDFLRARSPIYIEDYVIQHSAIHHISPSGLNTVRVITLLTSEQVDVLGAVFRISVNCPVDNYSAGNIAAEVDTETGLILTGGIRKRSTCDVYHDKHPVTGSPIKGITIPHWDKVVVMVKEAAIVVPEVRSVGWDVAITEDGPLLIEGNSKWNKDTWQIPAGYGKIHLISKYL